MGISIVFVRHGQTEANRLKIIQGQMDRSSRPDACDLGLNETGRAQAAALQTFIKDQGLSFDVVLTSDLRRAFETGREIAKACHVPIVLEKGLREMFFGAALEGLPVAEFKAVRFDPPLVFADAVDGSPLTVNDGETLRSYHKSLDPRFDNIRHPGGESKAEVRARAMAAIDAFTRLHAECSRLLIPTHNGLLRFIMPEAGAVDHVECLFTDYDPASKKLTLLRRSKVA